tara:strand:- start:331 stop:831 length:501 start_codon:yes stop_codon:yes gene_type:complete
MKAAHQAKTSSQQKQRRVIHPRNPAKIKWDLFCGVLIVYSVLVVPFRIGFDSDAKGPWAIIGIFTDCTFGIDMILCCFTAYYVEERLEMMLSNIRWRYLTTWFFPDLLSTVPIDKVAKFVMEMNKEEGAGGADEGGLAAFALIRVLRLARLFKLLRLMKLSGKASR